MANQYRVETDKGTYDVTLNEHHEHMSKADFERALVTALASLGSGILLHHYTFRGRA
jgi:hypothetical protein